MDAQPLTLHLPHSQLEAEGRLPFYQRLIDGWHARGGNLSLVLHDRATARATVEATPGFHILDHGRLRHPRALNAGVAYVYPFWHLDPWGIRAFSSIAAKHFDPARIPADAAASFAARLRDRLIGGRSSRYVQPVEVLPVPAGCVAVFECFNRSRYEEGDHVIFVGEVERCAHRVGASPLLFHGGRFYTEHPL